MRPRCLILFPLLLLLVGMPSLCWTQVLQQDQEPIRVQADTLQYDEQKNTVSASGSAVVTKGETTMKADTITVNRTANALDASGHVVVEDPQGRIEASTLRFELEDETGKIGDGTVRLPRNQYILTGKVLQKSYGQSYHIEDGAFTTCQCDTFQQADWSVAGKTIDVTLGGRGEVRDGTFRIRGVPLLYIPYVTVPVRTERQSGFLFPHYGFSSKRGFVWQQPFYWAIDRSYDLTLTTALETAARIGAWSEFRYAPNTRTEGQFAASYFNEQIRGPATTSTAVNRWSITGTHRQSLADDMRFYSDFFFVSDDLFLREISHRALSLSEADESADWTLRTRRFTDSRAGGVKTWQNALVRAEADYYQDLRQDQDFAFQVLPRVQFQGQQRLWHDRLEIGLAAEGANFFRNKGYAGQRFDLAPSVALPFHLGDYAFGSVRVTGRETAYLLSSQAPGLSSLTNPRLRGNRTREIVQVEANIGTRFSRAFNLGWGKLLKLQHVIEPELSYMYVPFVDQEDLPFYDALDRINRRNSIIYGVSNRLLGKFRTAPTGEKDSGEKDSEEGTEIRELARLTVTQAYDPFRGLSQKKEHYSDVDIYARLTPLPFTVFTFDSTYDVNNGSAATTRIGAFLRDPRPVSPMAPLLQHLQRSSSLGVFYRSTSDRLVQQFNSLPGNVFPDIDPPKEINISALLRLSDSLMASYVGRYDLNTSDFIGNRYFFRYISPQNCWFIDFGVVDKVNPREFEFRFLFTLVGLSSGSSAF
ncbi:MAG: LPS-assembly protein LptD [Deltaproteobacteria bacterium]|nr:LPS-assembly protein LptD [Deltaproteobacteria bacterium]